MDFDFADGLSQAVMIPKPSRPGAECQPLSFLSFLILAHTPLLLRLCRYYDTYTFANEDLVIFLVCPDEACIRFHIMYFFLLCCTNVVEL